MASKLGLYPTAKATITALLAKPVAAGAEAYAERLRDNISAGNRSGVKYKALPRQSSSPSEYPQEQSGQLKDSVDARPTSNPLVAQAGFFGGNQEQAKALEFGSVNMAERAPLQRSADQPETRQAMLTAAQKAGKGKR